VTTSSAPRKEKGARGSKGKGGTGPPPLALPDLAALPRPTLAAMLAAGEEALECQRVLAKGGLNLVGEVLKGHGTFYEYEHYPPNDVFDGETFSQYYYHAHRGVAGEHGHFHTFLRSGGMPLGVAPVAHEGEEPWPSGSEAIAHLIAVSMDAYGCAIGLFAVNRWVTGDTWYPATDVIRMLERFAIDHAYPSWPLNRWLTALFRLYRPHMETLLRHRDQVVARWAAEHPGQDVYEDRRLEVTGWLPVDLEEDVARLRALAGGVRRRAGAGR
jgi:hypothetical protein